MRICSTLACDLQALEQQNLMVRHLPGRMMHFQLTFSCSFIRHLSGQVYTGSLHHVGLLVQHFAVLLTFALCFSLF